MQTQWCDTFHTYFDVTPKLFMTRVSILKHESVPVVKYTIFSNLVGLISDDW